MGWEIIINENNFVKENKGGGAGEMAHLLRTLAALPSSVPSTTHYGQLMTAWNSNPRESGAFFWPLCVPHACTCPCPPQSNTQNFLKKKNFKMEHHWTEHSDFDVFLSIRDTELNGDLNLGHVPYKLLYLCTYINYFFSYFLGFTAIYESL